MRHLFFPLTAGDRQGFPLRVFAPHRRLESIGLMLRLWWRAIPSHSIIALLDRHPRSTLYFKRLLGHVCDRLRSILGLIAGDRRFRGRLDMSDRGLAASFDVHMLNGDLLLAFAAMLDQCVNLARLVRQLFCRVFQVLIAAPNIWPSSIARHRHSMAALCVGTICVTSKPSISSVGFMPCSSQSRPEHVLAGRLGGCFRVPISRPLLEEPLVSSMRFHGHQSPRWHLRSIATAQRFTDSTRSISFNIIQGSFPHNSLFHICFAIIGSPQKFNIILKVLKVGK
jgi:hypothetical protein